MKAKITITHLYKTALMLTLMLVVSSCMRSVSISMLRPAPITIPNHVQRLLIVDRTEPENQTIGIIEGILTGELPFEVKNAIEATLSSMQNELYASPRFEVIRASERLKGGLFSVVFPSPLDWTQINQLCEKYNADGVLALEMFSSTFVVTNAPKLIKKVIKREGKDEEVEVPGYSAEGIANIRVGFRFYDPLNRSIADQRDFSRTNTWTAEGETVLDAAAKMIDKVRATEQMGRLAGAAYAHRIAPMYVRVRRDFYHKPKRNQYMAMGARFGEVNDWQRAIDSWRTGINTSDRKSAARMTYNVALAYEVLGDLDQAKEWATRAYTRYGLKRARGYARIIDQRIWDQAAINEQLNRPVRESQNTETQTQTPTNNVNRPPSFQLTPVRDN
jgi:hypothetical protein